MFNLRSMDLNLLTVFEAIYEVGSVSGAADRLALSQSATSHALSRLREVCKDDLFVRTHQGFSPTPVARAMQPIIKQALDVLRAGLAEASGFNPARSERHFRICIPHPLAAYYALMIQETAATIAPNVVLTFDTESRPFNLEEELREGISDIAIDWLPITRDPFINQKLFDDRLALIARGDHPSVNAGVTIEDLRKEKFVGVHPRRRLGQRPQAIREFYELELPHKILVSELLEVPCVVASTDLLGMFPTSMAPLLEKRIGLRVLAFPIELPPLPIYLIWHETRRNDTGHCWLREVVMAELGEVDLVAKTTLSCT